MPYASRDEIAYAMRKSISTSLSSTNDPPASLREITEDDIDREMMLADSPPLDILVRTSGVNRLSDFMLWQANEDTQLHFIDCYWPEFGWKELAPIILDYQRRKLAEYARDWVKGALSKS
jgi:ditrans,polycis-polyprenyl diphosphate synthase